jgi:glycosyltransferase involved in cell wall biosynthesis
MRIVQLVETLAVGGLERMAVELAIAHRDAGHFSAIYTVFEEGPLAEAARKAGVPVTAFRKPPGFRPLAIARLASQLRRDRASIVHTHNASIHHYGALAGRLAGAAVVNTRHGMGLHASPRQDRYFRAVLPLTGAVVFVCDFGRRHFAARGCAPAAKSRVIHNGIPVASFQSRRASPGAGKPGIRFGTIGRLVEAKAHADLLAAFATVAREVPAAELSIWGYGKLQPQLETQIRSLGLNGRVAYRGIAERPEEALAQLDVFVLSSTSEGLPLVVMEAMAAGLPLVTTRVGGVPEVVPENAPAGRVGWFADPANPASLAAAMLTAARSDLAAAGDAAYRHAAAHFGVQRMQADYEALFRELSRR